MSWKLSYIVYHIPLPLSTPWNLQFLSLGRRYPLKQSITMLGKWRNVSRPFWQHMVDILHFNYVHSQIVFNGTHLKIYIDEKHGDSIVIQYARRDVDVGKMSRRHYFLWHRVSVNCHSCILIPCHSFGAPFNNLKKSSEIQVTSVQESSHKSTGSFSRLPTHPLVERTKTLSTEVPAGVKHFFWRQYSSSLGGH